MYLTMQSLSSAAMAWLAATPPAPVSAGKRGLAYPWCKFELHDLSMVQRLMILVDNENTNIDPGKLAGSQVNWMYNWETWRPARTGWVSHCLTCCTQVLNLSAAT